MSFEAMAWAWNLTGVSPLAKLVAIEIANWYGPFSSVYDCELDRLEKFTGAERADILSALDEIEGECGGFRVAYHVDQGLVRVTIPLRPMEGATLIVPPPQKRPHWVYVISAQNLTKIGISKNVKERFDGMQAWTPEQLVVIWAGSGPIQIIRKVERASHGDLAEHRAFGEWFRVSPETAVQTVQRQMLAHGLTLPEKK